MVNHSLAGFVVVIVYTACGTNGAWKEQLYQITKIAVDLLEGQTTLWVDIERSVTSCCAKCLFEEDCYLAVYFPNGTCNRYGRLWVLLTKPNENGPHADSYVMSRTADSVQCPDRSLYVEAAGTCYVFSDTNTTWKNALACKAIHSTLVEIETKEEGEFITKHPGSYPNVAREFWIGAVREGDVWKWATSGRLIEYTNWYEGNPRPNHNCAGMYTKLGGNFWFGVKCEKEMQAMCEKRIIE